MSGDIQNKRIAKNTVFLSIRMVVVLCLNLFTTRIVLQALGVVDYGIYNVVCGFVAMFAFINTSLSNGIQRFFNFEFGENGEAGAKKVYSTALYIQAMLAVIVVILIEGIGLWYINNKIVVPIERLVAVKWIFQLSLLTFITGIMQTPFTAAITAHEKMDFYALISVLDAVLKLVIAYLVIYIIGDKLIIYGVLTAVVSILNFVLYYIYCKKNFTEINFEKRIDIALFKKLFVFSGWNLFGTFSHVLENHGVNLILNFFFGPIVNAARAVAAQVNGGIQSFVSNITVPVRPQLIQSYAQKNIRRVLNLTVSISKISGLIVLMVALPISLEIKYILRLWLGSDIPEHTASFTVLIIVTSFFNILQSSLSTVVHATGKMKRYQLSCSFIRLLSLPLSFLLIRLYNEPEIPLVAVAFLTVIVLFVSVYIVHQQVGLSIGNYIKSVIGPLILMFCISLVLLYPLHMVIISDLVRLVVIVFSSILILGGLSFIILLDKNEKIVIQQMLLSMKNRILNYK